MAPETIKQRFNDIVSLGFTEQEVLSIIRLFPSILAKSKDKIQGRINDIMDLGYSFEETKQIIKGYPSVIGLNYDSLKEKIDLYDYIGIHEAAVVYPKSLMQSVPVTYAKYAFYRDKGIDINMGNCKHIFKEQKRFQRLYKVDAEDLLARYPYDDYLEERKARTRHREYN